jgi:hypothetical protein
MKDRGQLSIIAALLCAVVFVTAVATSYSLIRNNPIQAQPQIQSAIDETNSALRQILGFTVGYYGSILKVTGNTTYAKTLATTYLQSGLANIANINPTWASSFSMGSLNLYALWFASTSYSGGDLAVAYNLTGLGILGMNYATSCKLSVSITNSQNNQARMNVTQDVNKPLANLGRQNFGFYVYQNSTSTWTLTSPSASPTVYTNGTYQITPPTGVDANSYVVQVKDQRGIVVVASQFSSYVMNLTWPSTTSSYYYVNGASDVDGNGDIGTHSNFTAQQYGPDNINDTLIEANTISPVPETYVYCNNNQNPNSVWTNPSYAYNNNTATGATDNPPGSWTGYLILNLTGTVVGTSIHYMVGAGSGNHFTTMTINVANQTGSWTNVYNATPAYDSSNYYNATFNQMTYTAFEIQFYTSNANGKTVTIYEVQAVNASYTPPATYQLDLEEQWTNVNQTGTNKELDIFTGPFSSQETLSVQWWNTSSSSWITIIPNLTANSMNNISVVTYLTSPTFTIRFSDGTPIGDTAQSSWQIDAAFLRFDTNLSLSSVPDTITMELLQNGTILWLGQNLTLTTNAKPFPPLPTKAIHLNQTINSVNSEAPFQIEDWASAYTVPLGLTSNASIFNGGNMLVFLANNSVSRVTIWWNGSDTATQTPYAYTNRYFNDTVSASTLVLRNGVLTLNLTNPSTFTFTSTVNGSSCTVNFMRINQQTSTYGSDQPAYVITNGIVRDIIHQEPEWSNGVSGSPDVYGFVVLTLPARTTYFTYQLTLMFMNTTQNRKITDISPITLSALTGQPQTENGTTGTNGFPLVSNATGLFNTISTVWQHHWSQFVQGTNGAGIMFRDNSNQNLYAFDGIAGSHTGGLMVNSSAIQLLPISGAQVSFTNAMNIGWYGAVATFGGTTPIYKNNSQTGLWMLVEYPPTINVGTAN